MNDTTLMTGIAFGILSAVFCYFIADRNGMNKILWPLLGFFVPLIGAIAVLVVAFIKQGKQNAA